MVGTPTVEDAHTSSPRVETSSLYCGISLPLGAMRLLACSITIPGAPYESVALLSRHRVEASKPSASWSRHGQLRLVISPKPPPPLLWNGRAVIIALVTRLPDRLPTPHSSLSRTRGPTRNPFLLTLGRASGRCSCTTRSPGAETYPIWVAQNIVHTWELA